MKRFPMLAIIIWSLVSPSPLRGETTDQPVQASDPKSAESSAAPAESSKEESAPETTSDKEGSSSWVIERRRDQVTTEPGYIASPIAVNIPGIGFSYGLIGSVFNIAETEMDTFFFTTNGDSNGFGLGLIDTPVYEEMLTFNLFTSRFRDTGLESHRRGISSDPDDARILKFAKTQVAVGQLSLRLWEKRVQLNLGLFRNEGSLDKILDKEGEVIADPEDQTSSVTSTSFGGVLDLTDDRADPRRGVQFEAQYFRPPAGDAFGPEYYIMDYNFLAYVPVGKISTWVFNAYRSDAVVTRTGETDPTAVRNEKGINCNQLPPQAQSACVEEEDEIVAETIANNKFGTASSIGGTQRMRSYVTGRFKAAHATTFGTELRLNLTEEFTPFNLYVAKGVRTGIQLALFGEWGPVNDYESKLTEQYKRSLGIGVRFIVASGFIVRLDVAQGEEGVQPTLFFNYPWFVF
jgi:hypothetical protein